MIQKSDGAYGCPLVNIAIENGNLLNIVIFHRYVSSPEVIWIFAFWIGSIWPLSASPCCAACMSRTSVVNDNMIGSTCASRLALGSFKVFFCKVSFGFL